MTRRKPNSTNQRVQRRIAKDQHAKQRLVDELARRMNALDVFAMPPGCSFEMLPPEPGDETARVIRGVATIVPYLEV